VQKDMGLILVFLIKINKIQKVFEIYQLLNFQSQYYSKRISFCRKYTKIAFQDLLLIASLIKSQRYFSLSLADKSALLR